MPQSYANQGRWGALHPPLSVTGVSEAALKGLGFSGTSNLPGHRQGCSAARESVQGKQLQVLMAGACVVYVGTVEIGDMKINRCAAGTMDLCSCKPPEGSWAAAGTQKLLIKRNHTCAL